MILKVNYLKSKKKYNFYKNKRDLLFKVGMVKN